MLISRLITICVLFHLTSSKNNLVLLYDKIFDSEIKKYELLLVLFYVPWCVQSNNFMPKFLKAGEELFANNPPIYLARMDCTESGLNTCTKIHIDVFPHLRIYKKGVFFMEYFGAREAATIVHYMKGLIPPRPKQLLSNMDYLNYIKSDEASLVLFFNKNTVLKANYFKLFSKFKDKYRFAYTDSKEILDNQGIRDRMVLVRPFKLRNSYEPDVAVHLGKPDFKDLKSFIDQQYYGLAGIRTKENLEDFSVPFIVAYFYVDYKINPKVTFALRDVILAVAQKLSSKIQFAVSNKDDFQAELAEFGIDAKTTTVAVCGRDKKNQKFVLKGKYTEDTVRKFAERLIGGKLTPLKPGKGAAVSGFVKVAVGKNFEKLLKERDSFIFFFSTPCDQCNKVLPLYEQLASKLVNEEVNIIKMNIAKDPVPSFFKIESNPVFFWVSKIARSKPILYKGHWNVQDMLKFIASQSTDGLTEYNREGRLKKDEL